MGYASSVFFTGTAVGDQGEVNVGVGGEAARTEQAGVGCRSIETLPERREAAGDQLDLASIQGAPAPIHVGHVRPIHVHG